MDFRNDIPLFLILCMTLPANYEFEYLFITLRRRKKVYLALKPKPFNFRGHYEPAFTTKIHNFRKIFLKVCEVKETFFNRLTVMSYDFESEMTPAKFNTRFLFSFIESFCFNGMA